MIKKSWALSDRFSALAVDFNFCQRLKDILNVIRFSGLGWLFIQIFYINLTPQANYSILFSRVQSHILNLMQMANDWIGQPKQRIRPEHWAKIQRLCEPPKFQKEEEAKNPPPLQNFWLMWHGGSRSYRAERIFKIDRIQFPSMAHACNVLTPNCHHA